MLARIQKGNLNAVLVNVFLNGYAYYDSQLLEKQADLAPGYDPLAYVVEQAHERGIEVHVWLIAGPVGDQGRPGPILARHPDWGMQGPDGRQSYWLNYAHPQVRQFIGDVVLEIVTNYDVDGVHFDFTRYPGAAWSFDAYTHQAFAQQYGIDLDLLRYAELPAYGTFKGNPLVGVSTARVLASFDGGQPAVLLNSLGEGEVLLLNWYANERQVAAGGEILRRGIDYLLDGSGEVYILRSEANAERYGLDEFDRGVDWLRDMGWSPVELSEADLVGLEANAVLVMPNVYFINSQVALDLADFVRRGGGLIFIDGPTPSIQDENVQALTGMRARGRHFKETRLLLAEGEHPLILASERGLALEDYQKLDARWKAFREQLISDLLRDVYERVKPLVPGVLISVTVAAEQETLDEQHFLDWQAWLAGGYVDLVIPRAYVDQDERLLPVIANWIPAMGSSDQIALGLITHSSQNGTSVPKTPARLLSEVDLAYATGSNGVVLFDIERTGDDALEALAIESFVPPVVTSD